jgi:hypothetical protein
MISLFTLLNSLFSFETNPPERLSDRSSFEEVIVRKLSEITIIPTHWMLHIIVP